MELKRWEAVKSEEDQRQRAHNAFTQRDGTIRRGKENTVLSYHKTNKNC